MLGPYFCKKAKADCGLYHEPFLLFMLTYYVSSGMVEKAVNVYKQAVSNGLYILDIQGVTG